MIIFDLDGTLLNTAKDLEIALNYALRSHNFPEKTEAETLALLGNGIDALVAGALPQGRQNPDFEPVFATFKTYYSAHLNDYTVPYPGIIPLLQELRRRGVKMGIVSNKFDEGVKALAAKFFGGLIDYAPDAVFALIAAQNAATEPNIYVGDSEVDIETAQNAGLPCISVSWGFRTRDALLQHGAQTVIDRPEELLEHI